MKINKNKNRFYFAKNGFTLIEMLVVIAIIVIVIGAGIGMLSNRKNYEYKAEVDKIYKLITDAQANATKSSPVITIDNTTLLTSIGFSFPTNLPNNGNYVALLKINKIISTNNATINDSLTLEYFENIRRELIIDNMDPTNNSTQNAVMNTNNLPLFYQGNTLFVGNNYPISYMVLIRSNNGRIPIVFRTNGSLAVDPNKELYVQISHFPNNRRFRTYYIGIRGNNIKKYVR
jgi:prepilin-type N-terminal cleavage/methylation domain-containing protein